MSDLSQMVVTGRIIGGFDKEVGKIGMIATVKKILVRKKIKLELSYDRKITGQVLEKGPVIVTVNHPHQSDVMIIMAALPDREDFFMIAQSTLLGLGKNIDKHIIPVFINEKQIAMEIWKRWKVEIFTRLHSHKRTTREIEKEKNKKSVALASAKLDKKHMIIIFPTGGSGNMRWQAGIGHMIKGAKNPKLKIVMADIDGSSSWDYFRLIPGVSWLFPKIKVRFSAPIETGKLKKFEAKEIALKLETKCRKWLEN